MRFDFDFDIVCVPVILGERGSPNEEGGHCTLCYVGGQALRITYNSLDDSSGLLF